MSTATQLGDISEGPGVDDAADYGTWPSSSRSHHDESAYRPPGVDDPVFSRHGRGYSSARVGGTRRSRPHDAPSADHDDERFDSDIPSPTSHGGTTTSGDTDSQFSRHGSGYFSMRAPRPRRTRTPDVETHQSIYDDFTLPEGRTATSSGFFGNGHASSLTGDAQRSSSNVDVHQKSSPFDNINREDDASEPYTPIIGRHRLAYSSLRGKRRRPLFDPGQLYDNPADFVDEDLSGSDGTGRFSRVSHDRDAGAASELGGNLRRTVSSDLNWSRRTSDHVTREPRLSGRQREYESNEVRPTGDEDKDIGGDGTAEHAFLRQRAVSLDTSVLSVLSNLPADVKTRLTKSRVPDCTSTSTGDQSQPQTQLDHPRDEVGCPTTPPESSMSSSTVDEVPSTSQTESDVTSQVNERCRVDLDKTGDTANSNSTEPTASYSADSCKDTIASRADNCSPCSPDMFATPGTSAENNPGVHPADIPLINTQCSSSESPPRSPNDSCFSRLTKFRSSKNSRHAASSAADSTTKEPESSTSETQSGTFPSSKVRVRKRPSPFVGTAFSFPVSGQRDHEPTASAPAVVGSDQVNSESVSSNTEEQSHRQSEHVPVSVSSSTVDDVSIDTTSYDVKDNQTVCDVDDSGTFSSDVSPTAETSSASELPLGVESSDVQSSVDDDVPASQSVAAAARQRLDEDSAVYSAGVDSDASVRSAMDTCATTPTTDDDADADDVLVNADSQVCDQQDGQTDNTGGSHLDNNGCGSTMLESHPADGVRTDFNVEHHKGDVEMIDDKDEEVAETVTPGPVENGDAKDSDSSGRLSASSGQDELQHPQSDDDVNEDDATPNNKTATEEDEVVENGHGDDVTHDDVTDDRYVLATGVSALSDRSLVVADYGAGCVRLCDEEGNTEHRVTGLKPFSVATSTSDDDELIYVGDRRRKTLVVLDRHGADVAQWPDNQFDWICGIACLPDGLLAVLDRSRTRQLGIYPTGGDDGRPLVELGGQGTSLGDLCMAEFIAADSRGRVLISDSGNHCVKAFDRRVAPSSVVAVYGTARGSGDNQLEWPKGVAVDSADNVLVADCRNGRVVSFSVDGQSLGSVVPAVRGPFAVCTLPTAETNRRRLAVTTYSVSGVSEFRFYDYDTSAIFV